MKKLFVFIILFLFFSQLIAQEKPPFQLDAQKLTWGESQFVQILHDRPAMAKYVRRGDPVWNWAVRQFAGEWVQGGVKWDPNDPNPLADAFSLPRRGNEKSSIQVTERSTRKKFHFGELKTGRELWWGMVLELCNLKMSEKFTEVKQLVSNGKMGMEEHCFKRFFVEQVYTMKAVGDFFENLWLPNCQKLFLKPEEERMFGMKGVHIVVLTPAQFIKRYFSVDYEHPQGNSFHEEDYLLHHQFYKDGFEKYYLPRLLKNNIPTPVPMTMDELKRKMTAEFVPVSKQ